MVPRSTPDSRIHTSKVEPDSASGRPEEKPSSSTMSTRRCRYTAIPSRQEARAGGGGGAAGGKATGNSILEPEGMGGVPPPPWGGGVLPEAEAGGGKQPLV